MLGFGVDRPSMPRVAKRFFVKDGQALGQAFRRWSGGPDLERIIVSHGDVITDKPRDAQADREISGIAENLAMVAPQPSRVICYKSSTD
ncbi:hypothetical protein EOD10_08545 [Mesorhizobium sp. M7A.T.Ca.TU.009.01.3.2]|nr:hypothetical protein EOD10_08545 [Mesorhizobium sp. M7A.T.Ca.TU.009.01.3.2]